MGDPWIRWRSADGTHSVDADRPVESMATWKSRPSQRFAFVQKKVKQMGAVWFGSIRISTYSWPVLMDVDAVSWARFHSSEVQRKRNGEAAWIRRTPPAGIERTCRLNFQISNDFALRRLR